MHLENSILFGNKIAVLYIVDKQGFAHIVKKGLALPIGFGEQHIVPVEIVCI